LTSVVLGVLSASAGFTGVVAGDARSEVERRVEVRMERQALLHNENPLPDGVVSYVGKRLDREPVEL
jgi:hypothetical protein